MIGIIGQRKSIVGDHALRASALVPAGARDREVIELRDVGLDVDER